jgi:hypothetical protein
VVLLAVWDFVRLVVWDVVRIVVWDVVRVTRDVVFDVVRIVVWDVVRVTRDVVFDVSPVAVVIHSCWRGVNTITASSDAGTKNTHGVLNATVISGGVVAFAPRFRGIVVFTLRAVGRVAGFAGATVVQRIIVRIMQGILFRGRIDDRSAVAPSESDISSSRVPARKMLDAFNYLPWHREGGPCVPIHTVSGG